MRRTTRFVVYGGLAIGCLIVVGAAVVWNASTELMAPKRRVLQEYHREWLDRPAEHGVSIQRFTAMGGEVPCLVVMPDAGAGLSKRGMTVRRQLEEKGVALRPFGEAFANLVLLHGMTRA